MQSSSVAEPFSESAAQTSTDWVPRGHLQLCWQPWWLNVQSGLGDSVPHSRY